MPRPLQLIVLLAAAALLGSLPAQGQDVGIPGQDSDAAALLALRESIQNWDAFAAAAGLRGWDASLPTCQWSGVTCSDDGRVRSLILPCDDCAVRAEGSLPAELARLSGASTINLQGNAFGSSLPAAWGGEQALTALQNLYLNDNFLSGSLPDTWSSPGAFPQLSLLRIDGNALTGTLPSGLGRAGRGGNDSAANMPNLLVLRLFNNLLSGTLPPDWGSKDGSFPRLQTLALQNNSLVGSVPESWHEAGAMPFLQELFLQQNRLSGQLPGAWGTNGSWPQMRYFYLDNNPLGGSLPGEWGQPGAFPSLKVLGLNNTALTGTLPPAWGTKAAFPMADAFWLERNNLSGTIPASWANLISLRRLVIRPGNPALCGPVPSGLPFFLCTDEDVSCLRNQPALPDCSPAAGPVPKGAAAAGGATDGGAAPAAPAATGASSTSGGGGGGVSAAAIAAPVAVGAVVLAAIAGGLFVAARRRRRRRRQEEEEQRKAAEARPVPAHPFDTEEGRAALTSPFAANAFQSTIDVRDNSSADQPAAAAVAAAAALGAAASRGSRESRPSKYHDSAGTASGSSLSGGSHRSWMAKCARIETKSLPHSGLPELALAPAGVAAGAAAGRAGAVGRASLEMQPMVRPSPVGQSKSSKTSGPSAEAASAAAAEAAARAAEEEDVVAAMLAGEVGRPFSSEGARSTEDSSGSVPPVVPELPFSDWEISPADIQIVKRPDGSDWSLGSGGFGKVLKALRHGVQPVAVKVLNTSSDMRQLALADFRREIAILKACRDVNIVQFVGASLGPDHTMLVTEYMEGGNLMNNIAAGRVSWYRRGRKVALDVARGLVFLHSKRIVHFDLKSPNILLTRDGTAKIADVGMAKILARDYVSGVVGTLAWAAPEMLWGERCTEKADIYSYGILLWEICSGDRPVRGQLRDLRVPEECPCAVRDLILECLETRPSRRPSALQIVQRLQALPAEGRGTPSPRATPTAAATAAAVQASGRVTPPSAPHSERQRSGGAAALPPLAPPRRSADAGRPAGGSGTLITTARVLATRSRSESLAIPSSAAAQLAQQLQQWRSSATSTSETAATRLSQQAQQAQQQQQQQAQQQPSTGGSSGGLAPEPVRHSI